MIALTDIMHGTEDGKVIHVAKGDKVPSEIKGTALELLEEAGAVGEPVTSSKEVEDKDAQIEDLKRQLAEAQSLVTTGQGSNEKPSTK